MKTNGTWLIFQDRKVKVLKKSLPLLEIFHDTSLVGHEYDVKSDVSPESFETFICAFRGKEASVTADNWVHLELLSGELGFHGLDDEIAEFSTGQAGETGEPSIANLLKRFARYDRTIKELRSEIVKLKKLGPRLVALEERVKDIPEDITGRFENIEKTVNARLDVGGKGAKTVCAGLDVGGKGVKTVRRETCHTKVEKHEDSAEATKYKGETFGGIIAWMKKCEGIVQQTVKLDELVYLVPSTTCPYCVKDDELPCRMLDRNWSHFWASNDVPNSWMKVDFQVHVVCPTHYTLCKRRGSFYISKWMFEGSDDEKAWTVLDRRDTCELADEQCHTFQCEVQDHFFRYFRLTQTGKNRWRRDHKEGNNVLCLSEFEIFGTLKTAEKK